MDFVTSFTVALVLLILGLLGIVINRKSLLLILVSVELVLLSINFTLLLTSCYIDDIQGQIFAIFVLTVAAAESAIGLALLVVYYRLVGTISLDQVVLLKG